MSNQSRASKNVLIAILVVVVIALGALVGWLVMDATTEDPTPQPTPSSPTAPVATDEQDAATDVPKTMEFTSPKGVKILIDNWREDMVVSSPLTITGEVPGNWSFEASFPAVLTDSNDMVIAQEAAQLDGEWMTTNNVPFSVTLTFTEPTKDKEGILILRKDNPSGLPENDDAIEIPVRYL